MASADLTVCLGQTFESWKIFYEFMIKYRQETSQPLVRYAGVSTKNANKRLKADAVKYPEGEGFEFAADNYVCVLNKYGARKGKVSQSGYIANCPVKVRAVYDRFKKVISITTIELGHNHPLEPFKDRCKVLYNRSLPFETQECLASLQLSGQEIVDYAAKHFDLELNVADVNSMKRRVKFLKEKEKRKEEQLKTSNKDQEPEKENINASGNEENNMTGGITVVPASSSTSFPALGSHDDNVTINSNDQLVSAKDEVITLSDTETNIQKNASFVSFSKTKQYDFHYGFDKRVDNVLLDKDIIGNNVVPNNKDKENDIRNSLKRQKIEMIESDDDSDDDNSVAHINKKMKLIDCDPVFLKGITGQMRLIDDKIKDVNLNENCMSMNNDEDCTIVEKAKLVTIVLDEHDDDGSNTYEDLCNVSKDSREEEVRMKNKKRSKEIIGNVVDIEHNQESDIEDEAMNETCLVEKESGLEKVLKVIKNMRKRKLSDEETNENNIYVGVKEKKKCEVTNYVDEQLIGEDRLLNYIESDGLVKIDKDEVILIDDEIDSDADECLLNKENIDKIKVKLKGKKRKKERKTDNLDKEEETDEEENLHCEVNTKTKRKKKKNKKRKEKDKNVEEKLVNEDFLSLRDENTTCKKEEQDIIVIEDEEENKCNMINKNLPDEEVTSIGIRNKVNIRDEKLNDDKESRKRKKKKEVFMIFNEKDCEETLNTNAEMQMKRKKKKKKKQVNVISDENEPNESLDKNIETEVKRKKKKKRDRNAISGENQANNILDKIIKIKKKKKKKKVLISDKEVTEQTFAGNDEKEIKRKKYKKKDSVLFGDKESKESLTENEETESKRKKKQIVAISEVNETLVGYEEKEVKRKKKKKSSSGISDRKVSSGEKGSKECLNENEELEIKCKKKKKKQGNVILVGNVTNEILDRYEEKGIKRKKKNAIKSIILSSEQTGMNQNITITLDISFNGKKKKKKLFFNEENVNSKEEEKVKKKKKKIVKVGSSSKEKDKCMMKESMLFDENKDVKIKKKDMLKKKRVGDKNKHVIKSKDIKIKKNKKKKSTDGIVVEKSEDKNV